MSTQFDYDVFLSHSHKDKLVVRELARIGESVEERRAARVAR